MSPAGTPLNSLTNRTRSWRVAAASSQATYSSARLQVDTTTASRAEPRRARARNASLTPRAWKSSRSRSSTGAVRWLIPTSSSCTLEVVALREEIGNRHEIEQHDHEPERRKIGGPPSAPADPPRREQLEGIHEPAQQRHEDFRVLERHRLHPRIAGAVAAARLRRPDPADDHPDGQEHPANDDGALVHAVQHLQRRQPRIEETEVLGLDLLEQQHVGDADDAG